LDTDPEGGQGPGWTVRPLEEEEVEDEKEEEEEKKPLSRK